MSDLLSSEKLSGSSSTLILVDDPATPCSCREEDVDADDDVSVTSIMSLTEDDEESPPLPFSPRRRKVKRAKSLDSAFVGSDHAGCSATTQEFSFRPTASGYHGFQRKTPLCRWSDMFAEQNSASEPCLSIPQRSHDRFTVSRHKSDSSLFMPLRSVSRHGCENQRDCSADTPTSPSNTNKKKGTTFTKVSSSASPPTSSSSPEKYNITSPLLCKRSKKEMRLRRTFSEHVTKTLLFARVHPEMAGEGRLPTTQS